MPDLDLGLGLQVLWAVESKAGLFIPLTGVETSINAPELPLAIGKGWTLILNIGSCSVTTELASYSLVSRYT